MNAGVRILAKAVLVSDFDGTMTAHDFYRLALKHLLPADLPDYWGDYRAGRITHFQALQAMFAAIRVPEADVLAVVREMTLDPLLPAAIERLKIAGWKVVVASAGCRWYIERLLAAAGVTVEVHANPGHYMSSQGLVMEFPADAPFVCHELGVDKAAVVRHWQERAGCVAFAGDGFADLPAARLVPAPLRFARSDLADSLREEQADFQPFRTWSEIAEQLLSRGAP